MTTISCSPGYGTGGLGQAFAEVVDQHRRSATLCRYYTTRPHPNDALKVGVAVRPPLLPLLQRFTRARFHQGHRQFVTFDQFDRAVAYRISRGPGTHVGFAGQSLETFSAARQCCYARLEVVSATAHIEHVARQHALARTQYPIEHDWLSRAHRKKALAEYEMAQAVIVVSEYARQTFLENGTPALKLVRMHLHAHPRYQPAKERPTDGIFRIVYVGSLSVVKGVPLLLDAFGAAKLGRCELTLVGSTGSRPMRKFIARRCGDDQRIRVLPGDPLEHLQRANLCVHPSYQDGFPYSVLEALACGVPAIVSRDTGTKELTRENENGWIIPTGDLDALVAAMEHARSRC